MEYVPSQERVVADLDTAEQSAFDTLLAVREKAEKMLEEHRRIQEVFKRRPKAVEIALRTLGIRDDDPFSDVRRLPGREPPTSVWWGFLTSH